MSLMSRMLGGRMPQSASGDYLAAYIQGVTDRSIGRPYCDGVCAPHRLIVCVPDLSSSSRAGYRNGWLER
jgi:hypothetical protein